MRRSWFTGLVVVLSMSAAAPSALADDDSPLSSRLQELATKGLRDASHAQQAHAVSLLPTGAGSLERDRGSLVVEIRVDGRDHARSLDLADAGADVLHISHDYDTITAAVDESELRDVAAVPGVEYVEEVITPMTGTVSDDPGTGTINNCQTGVVSEGNTQLKADVAKTQFDVDGSGVKVGILSDSYDTKTTATKHAADDVASADLPGTGNPCGRTEPVQIVDDSAGVQADEGRAMLQIVHDVAPGASLAFATAFTGQTAFADNIRALANAGAKVIADDIIYFTEPAYQDGVIAQAVNDVTSQGVAYFSMAFNNNGNGLNSYEAPNGYRSTTCPATVLADRAGGADSCMDFDPGPGTDARFDITVNAGGFRLSLSWAEAMFGVNDDFDVYMINPNTADSVSIAGKSDNLTSQSPTDFGSNTLGGGTRQIVIRRYAGTGTPRLKWVSNDNGANSITATAQAVTAPDVQGPTIYGHNGADAAQTVGAVPFNNSNTIETFSSRGPVTSVFAPVNGTSPSAAFATPQVLGKPDVAATDGGITTFFGPGNRFFGTSAATPHAAAVAALQLSANPALTAAQVEQAQISTARPVGAFGPLAAGAGLIDAQAAINSAPPAAPPVTFNSGPSGPTAINNPTFTFTVGGHPQTVNCSIDGSVAQACSGSFAVVGPLADGPHTVAVTATDYFNQFNTGTRAFTVDTAGPAAPKIRKGPKKSSKSTKATFIFSGEPGASFQCLLDKGAFAPCTSPAKYKKLKRKKHTFKVEAADAVGNVSAATTYKWKVKKKPKKHHH